MLSCRLSWITSKDLGVTFSRCHEPVQPIFQVAGGAGLIGWPLPPGKVDVSRAAIDAYSALSGSDDGAHSTGSPIWISSPTTRTGYEGMSTTAGSVSAFPVARSKRAP
jgi:hypothetical protein